MTTQIELALVQEAMAQQAAGGQKNAGVQDVQAFNDRMAQAQQRIELGQEPSNYVLRLPPPSSWMESAAVTMDQGGAFSNTFDKYTKMSEHYQDFQSELLSFGQDLDFNDPATAVHVVEHQAKISGHMLEFQFVVQTAENVKHAATTLAQNQS